MNRETGALIDRSTITWRTQRWILVVYLALALAAVVSWGQGFTVVAFIAAGIAWLGQWAVTAVVLGFLGSRFGRFLRRSFFMAIVLVAVIIAMAVVTWMAFGADAHIDGWAVLFRIIVTLWISTFSARFAVLASTLEQEKHTQEALQVVRAESLDSVRTQRLEVVERVAGLMNAALERSALDSRQASEEISRFTRDVVRPLSHEIMTEDPFTARFEQREPKKASWRDIAEAVASRPALRPWLMAATVFFAFFLTTATTIDQTTIDASEASGLNLMVDTGPFLITVALLLGISLVTGISALVLQRALTSMLPRLGLRDRLLFLIAAPLVIAIIVELYVQVVYIAPGLAEQISGNLLVRLLPSISILVIALLIVINRSLAQVLVATEKRAKALTHELSWELSRLQCTYTREQRFFASQLHGPLQSTLTSASMRMAALEPATPEWHAALDAVRSDFAAIMERLVSGPDAPVDLSQSLDELRRTWAGVCEIDVSIDDDVFSVLNTDWISAGIVNDILVEACANAAIHGKAATVRIEVKWCAAEEISIVVTNDGSTDDGGMPGLGSAMLDRVAIEWSRTASDSGLQLRVVLAVPRTSGALVRA